MTAPTPPCVGSKQKPTPMPSKTALQQEPEIRRYSPRVYTYAGNFPNWFLGLNGQCVGCEVSYPSPPSPLPPSVSIRRHNPRSHPPLTRRSITTSTGCLAQAAVAEARLGDRSTICSMAKGGGGGGRRQVQQRGGPIHSTAAAAARTAAQKQRSRTSVH